MLSDLEEVFATIRQNIGNIYLAYMGFTCEELWRSHSLELRPADCWLGETCQRIKVLWAEKTNWFQI